MATVFWTRGQRTQIARRCKIRLSHLSEILHRNRGVSYERAMLLEKQSYIVCGYPIPCHAWYNNKRSDHPAFFGKPKKR